jgi:aspartyl/asparaginyl beta-hydroxylase (cupin superfamily)
VARFLNGRQFPQLTPLLDNWVVVRDEFAEVAHRALPWVESYLHNGGWEVFGLIFNGQSLMSAHDAPRTMGFVQDIPGVFIAGFSVLLPGAVIRPHVGYSPDVWRSHLCLFSDGEAFLDVGDERYTWRTGESVVFDDTESHSAGNPGREPRVVLIVDFKK